MQVLIQPYGKSEISLLQINYKGQQVKMLNISKKNRDNELWSDEQYKEIIHCVQQSKDQKWKFEQDVEQWILNTIHPYDYTELRHNSTPLSELRNSAGELIRDYISLCAWETINNNWTYNDELCELSNLAYDFSCSGRFVNFSEKEYIKWNYKYWEENFSSRIDFCDFLKKEYENKTGLFSILVLLDYNFDSRDNVNSMYKGYWKFLSKFFKDKKCSLHLGIKNSLNETNTIRVLVNQYQYLTE
ncbi:MAG: hypothetical protein SOT46_06540 [Treponema sp.]|nr:hypothetical protein [Treponema sp.]